MLNHLSLMIMLYQELKKQIRKHGKLLQNIFEASYSKSNRLQVKMFGQGKKPYPRGGTQIY